MGWQDYGLIFAVDSIRSWMHSHAYVPTVLELDDRLRIFCAFWDVQSTGRLGYVDVDKDDPLRVLGHSPEPIFPLGEPGTFDENGVTPLSCLREQDGTVRLYYAGWQHDQEYRYKLFTGLAVSTDGGGRFTRHSPSPVIGPTPEHPQVRTGGMVLKEPDGYRTWFAESVGHLEMNGKSVPTYTLSHMRSRDGIRWPDTSDICFPTVPGVIFGYGRSAVWREDGRYHGLFSVRQEIKGYTIGYAHSPDGVSWSKLELEGGMAFTPAHCRDRAQQVMFPSLYHAQDASIWMFYNGQDFGREGLRLARWTAK